jgi:Mrp family chromosome partitioning ATPase
MSAIDRAFLRAYDTDDDAPSTADARRRSRSPAPLPTPHLHQTSAAPPASTTAASSERRPLSSFTSTTPQVEARFRPGLEVDGFRWSRVNETLVQHHRPRWDAVIAALLAADDAGCSLIGVGGAARGIGATTTAACLARLLVDAGKTVALVDGDFATAGLARELGLAVDIGWEDVLAGRAPLADAIIQSIGDRLAVLPLVQGGAPAAEKLDAIHASITAGVLRYHYDIVLFDLGAVASKQQGPIAARLARRCRLDGFVLTAAPGAAAACEQQLAATTPELAGIGLGVIENQLIGR